MKNKKDGYEVEYIEARPIERVCHQAFFEYIGEPLSGKELKKEQKRIDKIFRKYKKNNL